MIKLEIILILSLEIELSYVGIIIQLKLKFILSMACFIFSLYTREAMADWRHLPNFYRVEQSFIHILNAMSDQFFHLHICLQILQ